MHSPRWELRKPDPALRHDKRERFVRHRFPIKGGFNGVQVMTSLLEADNALLAMLRKRNG